MTLVSAERVILSLLNACIISVQYRSVKVRGDPFSLGTLREPASTLHVCVGSTLRCRAVTALHQQRRPWVSRATAVIWYTPIQGVIFEPAIIGPAMAQRRTLPLLKVLFAKTASRTDANANAFANAGVRERLPSPPGLANKQRTNANSGCSPTLFVGVFANARHCF